VIVATSGALTNGGTLAAQRDTSVNAGSARPMQVIGASAKKGF
jgi:hypothetical protein